MSDLPFHWQCGHVTWPPPGSSSSSPVSEGDWMSIFGHVGAPADALCLITRCLLSAGWPVGENSSFSTVEFLSPRTRTACGVHERSRCTATTWDLVSQDLDLIETLTSDVGNDQQISGGLIFSPGGRQI